MTPEFTSTLNGIGLRYVSRRGRGGCYFERMVAGWPAPGLDDTRLSKSDSPLELHRA